MASRLLLWPARVLTIAVLLGLLAWISNMPYGEPAQLGLLRLAWRVGGEKVKLCRRLTPEELASIPSHMRREGKTCRVRILPFRLRVLLDDTELVQRAVVPSGAHGDRPLFVQEDLPVAPGAYRLRIEFVVAPDLATGKHGIDATGEEEQQALREALAKAHPYTMDRPVQSRAGRITLVELVERERSFRVTGG